MSNEILINNLFEANSEYFLSHLSTKSKEHIFKECTHSIIEEMVQKLNENHQGIVFYFGWISSDSIEVEVFENRNAESEEEGWENWESLNSMESMRTLSDKCIENTHLKLVYRLDKKCDLGYRHITRKFYYYSMAKVVEFTSIYMINKKMIDEFVKNYVPNFFY